jgi:succinoglycan biosynthesis protein ExoA
VLDQEYLGELEVIIAVGPSSDRTRDIADALAATDPRIRVVDNPAGRTPTALNLGIAASRHKIIVRVDGHGELTDGYISRAVELLAETGAANVGGVMDAQGTTPFEEAVATAYTTRLGLGGGAFHLADSPAAETETVFLGVFRKDALIAVGGFDETMHRAQDWELNYRLRTNGHKIWFSPELRVTYRPRSTLRALMKQMYETGKWRRELVKRHPSRFPRSSGLSSVDHRWLASRSAANVGGGSAAATAGLGGDSSRVGSWLPDWPSVIPVVEGLAGVWHTLALFRIAERLLDG